MRVAIACLFVAGCSFDPAGIQNGGGPDARIVDGTAPDGVPFDDANNPCMDWDALNVEPCDAALPAPVTLALAAVRHSYDTDTGVLTSGGVASTPPGALVAQSGGPELRVLNLTGFSLAASGHLVVVGSRPLVVIVHGDASVDGTIDVAAQLDEDLGTSAPGPGGNDDTECAGGFGEPGKPSTGMGGGGGGGGGGFGADGSDGSDGHGSGHGAKGAKGSQNGSAMLTPLRGGCRGGPGGDEADPVLSGGGAQGDGGGAIEITALGTINVTGTIAAGGTGGFAAQLGRAGGGGGGSGGAILLDGEIATVTPTASLCANGGGGGEGGQLVTASEDGQAALCSEIDAADGGALNIDGGDGGSGGIEGDENGGASGSAGSNAGGGGGAGSVGRIRVRGRTTRTVDDAAILSPAPGS